MAIIPGDVNQNIAIDTPQKQKSRKLLFLLVALVALTGLVVYFGFGGGSAGSPGLINAITQTEQREDEAGKNLEKLNTITLNNQIFVDKKFESLVASDQLPVVVGTKGRENPFVSF